MSAAETRERPARTDNPHGEVHGVCLLCHPDCRRAKCGSALKGIRHQDGRPWTCAVCADIGDHCLECGR
jgi:hypothetical protein